MFTGMRVVFNLMFSKVMCSDVRLNRQESAEAIVSARRRLSREGPNMIVREVHGKLERKAKTAENLKRELPFRRKW